MADVAGVARRLRQLDAGIRPQAGEPVEPVVDPRRERPRAEAVGDEVDGPQHDRARPPGRARDEPAGAGQRVEAEPRVHRRRQRRYERVEQERRRRAQSEAHRALRHEPAAGVAADHVAVALLGRKRVEDGDDAGAVLDEVVAQRLRRSVREAVGDDRVRARPGHRDVA